MKNRIWYNTLYKYCYFMPIQDRQ